MNLAVDMPMVAIVRMEVPCYGGLELAEKKALQAVAVAQARSAVVTGQTERERVPSGMFIQWQVVNISLDWRIIKA